MVEVNCETDFVAKNPDFAAFAKALAELVANAAPADVAALSALKIGDKTVEETRQALVQKIGENITVRRFERMQTAARLAQYVHGVKIGVMVEFEGQDAVGKDVAMHIAFAKPRFLSQRPGGGRGDRLRAHDHRGAREGIRQARGDRGQDGRGRHQQVPRRDHPAGPAVREGRQADRREDARRRASRRSLSYRFLVVGEGIEKKQSDFAAEVAAMTKTAA